MVSEPSDVGGGGSTLLAQEAPARKSSSWAVLNAGHFIRKRVEPDLGGAGWAFRQALDDLRPYALGNDAFVGALEEGELFGHLDVAGLPQPLRGSVLHAITAMCTDIASGVRLSTIYTTLPDDRVAHERYHEALKDLLAMATATARGSGE